MSLMLTELKHHNDNDHTDNDHNNDDHNDNDHDSVVPLVLCP